VIETTGAICSARWYAGGDAVARRLYRGDWTILNRLFAKAVTDFLKDLAIPSVLPTGSAIYPMGSGTDFVVVALLLNPLSSSAFLFLYEDFIAQQINRFFLRRRQSMDTRRGRGA
jgi:hypothetical protein